MNFNNFKKATIKQKIALFFFIFLLAELTITYTVLIPTIKAIIEKKELILMQKIELEEKISREKNMAKLSEKLKIIKPQIEIIENTFINKNRELEFITTLEGIALKNNVIQKLNLKTANNLEKNYIKIPLNINVQGAHDNILNYMVDLENYKYYININSLQFSFAQDNYSLSISADSYWK